MIINWINIFYQILFNNGVKSEFLISIITGNLKFPFFYLNIYFLY
jgi:hypothetical protein